MNVSQWFKSKLYFARNLRDDMLTVFVVLLSMLLLLAVGGTYNYIVGLVIAGLFQVSAELSQNIALTYCTIGVILSSIIDGIVGTIIIGMMLADNTPGD